MMQPFPEEHELIWLFEGEPKVEDVGVPWAYNHLTFRTLREDDETKCEIERGYEALKLTWSKDGIERVNLDLHWVSGLKVIDDDNTEALEASFRSDQQLESVLIQLKSHIRVSVCTRFRP